MPSPRARDHSTVDAVLIEVLPKSGLAYAVDQLDRTWTVTRQALESAQLTHLTPGCACELSVAHHDGFCFVEKCRVLN